MTLVGDVFTLQTSFSVSASTTTELAVYLPSDNNPPNPSYFGIEVSGVPEITSPTGVTFPPDGSGSYFSGTATLTYLYATPEPSGLVLGGLGLGAVIASGRRHRRRSGAAGRGR